MAHLPEAYALRTIPWQLFCTLTFKGAFLPAHIRKQMLHAWLRSVAKRRAYFPDLLVCSRLERDGDDGHPHFHVIVAGLTHIPQALLKVADAEWRRRGGGFTRIELFDPSRDGVGYILKAPCNYGESHRIKDDEIYIPTLSPSVLRFLRRKG